MQIGRIQTTKESLRNAESPIIARRGMKVGPLVQEPESNKQSQISEFGFNTCQNTARRNDQTLTTVIEIADLKNEAGT
jgi:hypothetical protein